MLTVINRIVLGIMGLIHLSTCEASQSPGFIFVRHGESQWNPLMIHLGPQDLPLSPLGQSQAEDCANMLKTYQHIKIDKIYSSPLVRARETADILNKGMNLPLVVEQGLEERYFGDHRLLSKDQRDSKQLPSDAEPHDIFVIRVMATLSRLMKQEKGVFIIVAHEKVFECLAQTFSPVELKMKLGGAYYFQCPIVDSSKKQWRLFELGKSPHDHL